jgi:hypothetical protein
MSFQTKQGERKIADAALKRAMLGREEAEETMRRYRDDNKALQRKYDEEKEKVNKLSHRYETLMACYVQRTSNGDANYNLGKLCSSKGNTRTYKTSL